MAWELTEYNPVGFAVMGLDFFRRVYGVGSDRVWMVRGDKATLSQSDVFCRAAAWKQKLIWGKNHTEHEWVFHGRVPV